MIRLCFFHTKKVAKDTKCAFDDFFDFWYSNIQSRTAKDSQVIEAFRFPLLVMSPMIST